MRQFLSILVAFLFSSVVVFAQRPALVPAPTPAPIDSTRQPRPAADSIPPTVERNGVRVETDPVTAPSARPELTIEGADTVRVSPKQEAKIRKIIPRQATIRSLIIPGLGQAYNRQYYKIPFIYGGFGVIGYFFLRYRGLAKEAEDGYRLLLYGRLVSPAQTVTGLPGSVPGSIEKPVRIPAVYEKVEQVIISDNIITSQATAKSAYDLFRRYRDLNTILFAVLWAVNAVEANVAAHLKTFDLSDDISMRVHPTVLPMPGMGFAPGVRLALTFK